MENKVKMVLPDIEAESVKYLYQKRRNYQCNTNRISSLDDPCERRLVYRRTNWADAKPVDVSLQGIFEIGTEMEGMLRRYLEVLGEQSDPKWRLINAQAAIDDKLLNQYQISGTSDCDMQIEYEGKWVTIMCPDIKTCSDHVYQQLNSYDDLSKYPWTKKYRGQVMLYAFGRNIPACGLILFNKQNPFFRPKLIAFDVDFDYVENLLQKAQRVNAHLQAGTFPDQINRPEECSRCAFDHICMPDLEGSGNLELCDNPEIEDLLIERRDLEQAKKRFDAVERSLKAKLIEGQDLIIGDFIIKWSEVSVSYKAKEACSVVQHRKKILYTGPDDDGTASDV